MSAILPGAGISANEKTGLLTQHECQVMSQLLATLYSYFHLSENKTINVFPIDHIVQLSKLTRH